MKDIDDIRRDNLRAIEAEAGGPSEAAKLLGMSPAQFSNLREGAKDSKTGKRRGMRKETARRIEEAAGKPVGWLDLNHAVGNSNVEAGPVLRGQVPLISWVRAGEWCEASEPLARADVERWMDCPVSHSAGTYALRVRGDSMTAPSGAARSYPEGSFIFVDPERRSPVNGERVVACLKDSNEVTFKVYKNEDGKQWLMPLNPLHEPIREKFHILGTVLGKWEDG